MDYFIESLDMGYGVDAIYLDFQKAFDSVPHKRLLSKFVSFGIQGKLLKWINNFLTNRQQQVVLNGQLSHTALLLVVFLRDQF